MTDSTEKLHILITGATSGIGKQLAKDYLLADHHVYAVGRDDEALAELQALGAETIDLDLMDREKVIEAFGKNRQCRSSYLRRWHVRVLRYAEL